MSGRNPAVMQQRQEARDALDDFPTPMWATRALCAWLAGLGYDLEDCVVREPCANRGYMVIPLREHFKEVLAQDVHDYGAGFLIEDFLFGPLPASVDWTIMNPPFRLALRFIKRALETSQGVAVFCRNGFLEGAARYQDLFLNDPPHLVLQFCERVVIHKGAMRRDGDKYWEPDANDGAGKWKTASSATSYCRLIWLPETNFNRWDDSRRTTILDWIPPCRKALERPGDYDPRGDLA